MVSGIDRNDEEEMVQAKHVEKRKRYNNCDDLAEHGVKHSTRVTKRYGELFLHCHLGT